jgi:hypothetical protein
MKQKKIYIAGKVTGEPIHDCTMKFGDTALRLERLGYEAVNPLEVVNDWKAPWDVAMRKCIKALMDCDAIFMLKDSKDSPGAKIELSLAEALNIPVLHEMAGLAKKTKVY